LQEFLGFLKTVDKQTPKEKALHVIVDNYSTHKHVKVNNWLKKSGMVFLGSVRSKPLGSE